MKENKNNASPPLSRLCVGLLAHVDSGKTTLAESLLYLTGSIRKVGRVDHGDAFLDTFEIEKKRGITVFSKQAAIQIDDRSITLLDTPGHMDFSAEMERTLSVLDYAILIISAADGVTGHTQTLWKLLRRYHVPAFIFVNKMDQPGMNKDALLAAIHKSLGDTCVDFTSEDKASFHESLAMCGDEAVLDDFLESGAVSDPQIRQMIAQRRVFPVYFGSALKMKGIDALIDGLASYTVCPDIPDEFGARIYKISRDHQGKRLTHLKVTGGTLKVKSLLEDEKIDQIRIYSGASFTTVDTACPGMICAVTGPEKTQAGQGLGIETQVPVPLLIPVLNYRLLLPENDDVYQVLLKLRQLEEEEPQLNVIWDEALREIYVQLMGDVQTEILKSLMMDRFGITVAFDAGHILYKETINSVTEGVGHFEPLRHYAEVHLLLQPGEPGSGLTFDTDCGTDRLSLNWQRLILTHLRERQHLGVLTGSPLTDIHITLADGRAHIKHTEGGDFRQATYRAVRHGLMNAENVLLEPVYSFRLEVPASCVGRAMNDLTQMHGTSSITENDGEHAVLEGTVPVATIRGYQTEVLSYTKGTGHLICEFKGYEPCHNAQEIIDAIDYDPEADTVNTADSVFCSHGAGYVVNWQDVENHMHLESILGRFLLSDSTSDLSTSEAAGSSYSRHSSEHTDEVFIGEDEVEALFKQTLSANTNIKKRKYDHSATSRPRHVVYKGAPLRDASLPKYLLVDGYNIIFAWEDLSDLAKSNLHSARTALMDILCNYQGYKKMTLILVFDAYKVEGGTGSVSKYKNIHVVYTKEAETADQYIEKTVHEIGRKYDVTVATSDGLEQVIIMGQGAKRMSAAELRKDIDETASVIRSQYLNQTSDIRNYLLENASEVVHEVITQLRKDD